MPKLLFYTKINFSNQNNIAFREKVLGQCAGIEVNGIEAHMFGFDNENIFVENRTQRFWSKKITTPIQKLQYQYFSFLEAINIKDYDYLYIRYFLMQPLALLLLWKAKRIHPKLRIIIEVPTFPYTHAYRKQPLQLKLDRFCSFFLHNWVERIVTYSDDSTNIFSLPTQVISNGIEVAQFKPPTVAKFEQILHWIGIANVQPWHGYDYIINGLSTYYKNGGQQNIVFHIVGEGTELPQLKALCHSLALEKHVVFHGTLFAEKLENLCQICHLGIGNLAAHRAPLQGKASPLKAREYCVRGLPFVQDYGDDSFPDDFLFFLKIAIENRKSIDIQSLIDFNLNILNQYPNYANDMYAFAKIHLDWHTQMKKVLL